MRKKYHKIETPIDFVIFFKGFIQIKDEAFDPMIDSSPYELLASNLKKPLDYHNMISAQIEELIHSRTLAPHVFPVQGHSNPFPDL